MSLDLVCSDLRSVLETAPANSLADYSALSSNRLRDLLKSGDYSDSAYTSSVRASRAIWYFVAVVALMIYFSLVINGIWMRSYPEKAKGRWTFCRRPRTQRNKKRYFFGGLLFCFVVFVASIAGAAIMHYNKQNGNAAACSMLELLDESVNGNANENWGGLQTSQISYNQLRDRFKGEVYNVNVTFPSDMTAVSASIEEYTADFDLLYNTRNNYKVKSARITDDNSVLIDTDFIEKLGPKDESGTYLNALLNESSQLSETVFASSIGLENNIKYLRDSNETIQNNLTKAASGFEDFATTISAISQDMSSFIRENFEGWTNLHEVTGACFIVFIIASLMLFITLIVHYKTRSRLAVQTVYILWHLLMIWTVVTAFVAANLQAMKKRTVEYCDVFNLLASDESFYDSLQNQYPVAFPKTLKTCFFDNGRTYNGLNFGNGTGILKDMSDFISEAGIYMVNGPGSREIARQKSIMDLYIEGLLFANSSATNVMGPIANLEEMNSWANYEVTGSNQEQLAECKVSRDSWVMNTTNCTTNIFNQAYKANEYFGESVCLGLYSVDAGTIGQRYNDEKFARCASVGAENISEILINNYQGLNRHFDDVRRKFRFLKDFYNSNLNDKYQDVLETAVSITGPIQRFNQSFGDYLDYVTGNINGIIYNANCSFFKPKLLAANSFVCDLGSEAKGGLIALIISTIFGIIGSVLVYLYLRKLETYFRLIEDQSGKSLRSSMRSMSSARSSIVGSLSQINPEPERSSSSQNLPATTIIDSRNTLEPKSYSDIELVKSYK